MINISVYYSCEPRSVFELALSLPKGSSVEDALIAVNREDPAVLISALEQSSEKLTLKPDFSVAIWSKPVAFTQLLRDLDRIEVLRPIKVDPKVARRERFKEQGAKSAGLFARRREGSKAGY